MALLLPFAVAALALACGLYFGRGRSRVALACCGVGIVVCAVASHVAIDRSGEPGWAAPDAIAAPASIGMLLIFAALGLVGPAFMRQRQTAIIVSGALAAGFVVTVFPMLFAGCYLFGMCV